MRARTGSPCASFKTNAYEDEHETARNPLAKGEEEDGKSKHRRRPESVDEASVVHRDWVLIPRSPDLSNLRVAQRPPHERDQAHR